MSDSELRNLKELMVRGQIDGDELSERFEVFSSIDDRHATQLLHKKIMGVEKNDIDDNEKHRLPFVVRHSSFLKIAASFPLVVVGGAILWYSQYTKVTSPEISPEVQLAMQQSRESGKMDANITILETERITQGGYDNHDHSGSAAKGSHDAPCSTSNSRQTCGAQLVQSLTKEQLLAARRITTQHDKEFWLTLDDGTLVHLNYNSRLIYPEKFGRGDRNVILKGEAYFMVAKDRSRQFIVHVPDGKIRVYGTEFNVNTENNGTSVVLVKGSLSVTPSGGKEQLLRPNEQCRIANSLCSIESVDVEPYVAWNKGVFCFDNCTLEHLMNILSHWYGKEVRFVTDDIREITFTGNLNKYSSIEPAIQAIHMVTGLRIEIINDMIIISKHYINP